MCRNTNPIIEYSDLEEQICSIESRQCLHALRQMLGLPSDSRLEGFEADKENDFVIQTLAILFVCALAPARQYSFLSQSWPCPLIRVRTFLPLYSARKFILADVASVYSETGC